MQHASNRNINKEEEEEEARIKIHKFDTIRLA
jgi:hypothetical protein